MYGGQALVATSPFASVDEIVGQAANFFGGDEPNRGGGRLTAEDPGGEAEADLVPGAGVRAVSWVTGRLGVKMVSPAAEFTLDGLDGFTGGVFVG